MPAITLSSASPNVTLTGLTEAYGTIGSYFVNYLSGPPGQTAPVEAAIFGTATTNFFVLNTGTIRSPGTNRLDAGIVLGGVGAVRNTGTIIAPSGIFILGLAAGAYAANTGYIHAEKADGIDILGTGGVNNSGLIIAGTVGIFDGGGLVDNFGTVVARKVDGIDMFGDGAVDNGGFISAAASGIFDDVGPVENSGTIIAGVVGIKAGTGVNAGIIVSSGYGVLAYGAFTNTSTASISAPNGNGIDGVIRSAIYNDGRIDARNGIDLAAESSFYNTGIVNGSIAGVYQGFNFNPYANGRSYITNYLGDIAGAAFGIEIKDASAYIYNAGLVTGATAVADYGVIVNRGLIQGVATGVAIYGALTNTGTITGAAGVVGLGRNTQIVNSGSIFGRTGIHIACGTITNTGLIEGRDKDGVHLTAHHHTRHGRSPGYIYNEADGTIIGAVAAVGIADGGTLVNSGTIISAGGDGVDLASQSLLFNRDALVPQNQGSKPVDGTISGARYGVSLAGAGYLYNNAGTITGASAAVYMAGLTRPATTGDRGAYFYNYGTLTGGQYGILNRAGTINIFDYKGGTITGQTAVLAANAYLNLSYGSGATLPFISGAAGIVLTQGGTVLNGGVILATGTAIYAGAEGATIINRNGGIQGDAGIVLAGAGYVYNSGGITGFTLGIDLKSGGTIVNDDLIYTPAAVTLNVGSTVYDAISISGGGTVINKTGALIVGSVIFGAGANRLVLYPGSRIETVYDGIGYAGTVELDGGILELAATKGTLGVAYAFDEGGASAITIDKSANWTFAAYESFAATAPITNDGTIHQISGSGATIAAAITGQGIIDIKTGTLTLDGAVGAGQQIEFKTFSAELALGDPANFAAAIQNFGPRDTIDLTGLALSEVQGLTFAAGILTLTETEGDLTFTFSNPGHFANETFSAVALGAGTGLILTPATSANIQNPSGWLVNNPISLAPTANPLITLQT